MKRGRPRHPDILTPREWEVLALLRERLSNEQIGLRLDITERTAKYHVAEILGKLGVTSREEAAAWQPAQRVPMWGAALAPAAWLWRKAAALSPLAAAAGAIAAALGGLALLAFLLLRGDGASVAGLAAGEERLAFSAGGSIYTVALDGSGLREVIPGDRDSVWNASPAFSPDGLRLAFTRDFDIWVANADGSDVRRLADVAPPPQTPPDGAASNSSLGAQSVAWSPDGERIVYVLGRIGGSGIQDLWVMRSDGTERTPLFAGGAAWVQAAWLDHDRVAILENSSVRVFRTTGVEEDAIKLVADEPSLVALLVGEGEWLVGPITEEGPITLGSPDAARKTMATGISPTLAPGAAAFAYFAGDTFHIAEIGGSWDETVIDLAPLGGRDRHFSEQPACFPNSSPPCSYRLPEISWSANVYHYDDLGLGFRYPPTWVEGAPPTPYASCFECVVLGPSGAEHPYGVQVFTQTIDLAGPDCGGRLGGCPVTAFVGNRALPQAEQRELELLGGPAWQQEIERQAPLGLVNETGDDTPYREIWTVLPVDNRALVLIAFWRDGDTAAREETRAAYEALLRSLRVSEARLPAPAGEPGRAG